MSARMWLGVGAAVLALAAGAVALLPPSAAPRAASVPALDPGEQAKIIAALRPPKRSTPVVAVLGLNVGTETTDYIVPYGVLRASGVAEVAALATQPGPLHLMPALTLDPGATIADFDARHPE